MTRLTLLVAVVLGCGPMPSQTPDAGAPFDAGWTSAQSDSDARGDDAAACAERRDWPQIDGARGTAKVGAS